MKLTKIIFCLTLLFSNILFSSAKDIHKHIIDMQMKFVKYVEANDSDSAYRIADSLKAYALKHNRLKVYYYCYNNLVTMECNRGKFHQAIHISQDLHKEIEKRKAFEYIPEYYKCLSTIHSARGDQMLGLEYLLKAEEKSQGKDKNIYIRIAKLLINMGKPAEAIKWADKAEESKTDMIKSNGVFYKAYAYYKLGNRDSFNVYYERYAKYIAEGKASPNLISYIPFMRSYMDADFNQAIQNANNIKATEDKIRFKIEAYEKKGDIKSAFDLQKEYIKHKDSINETIVHEDLLAMNHSFELAEKNNELAKQRHANMILAITIATFCVLAFITLFITRQRFIKKLKKQNDKLTKAINAVKDSARIRRAMIEDIKEKSEQPQNILRTYSKIITDTNFNIIESSKKDVLPNIRNSINILSSLSTSIVHMYRNDEQAQQIAENGKTRIENSRSILIDCINSLSGFLDIMETGGYNIDDIQMADIAMHMHLDMKSITILFDTILDMAYYDSFESLPLLDNVSVNEVCQTMIAEFIQRRKNDVKIEYNTKLDNNVTVKTYYSALYKMLKYTLDNADKFTNKGIIEITCKKNNEKILISFTDTGCGIAKENQDLVFKRFFRTDSQYHGVGLGLPICERIGKLINAQIYLDKSYENGCRFIIEL